MFISAVLQENSSYLPGRAGLGCKAMGGGGPTTGSCVGLCTASIGGKCIKEAERTYRIGSANLKFGKRLIFQTMINLLSHPGGMIS